MDDTERLRELMREELSLAGLRPGEKVARSKLGAVLCRASRRMLTEHAVAV